MAAFDFDLLPPTNFATSSNTGDLSFNTSAFSSQVLSSAFVKWSFTAFLISSCSPAKLIFPLATSFEPPSPTNITLVSLGSDLISSITLLLLTLPSPCSTPIIIEPFLVVSASNSSPFSVFLFFKLLITSSVFFGSTFTSDGVSLFASAFLAAIPISSAN